MQKLLCENASDLLCAKAVVRKNFAVFRDFAGRLICVLQLPRVKVSQCKLAVQMFILSLVQKLLRSIKTLCTSFCVQFFATVSAGKRFSVPFVSVSLSLSLPFHLALKTLCFTAPFCTSGFSFDSLGAL